MIRRIDIQKKCVISITVKINVNVNGLILEPGLEPSRIFKQKWSSNFVKLRSFFCWEKQNHQHNLTPFQQFPGLNRIHLIDFVYMYCEKQHRKNVPTAERSWQTADQEDWDSYMLHIVLAVC